MSIEYTIEIKGTRVKNEGSLTDVVKEVSFNLTGEDRGCTFTLPLSFKLDSPTTNTFVPFEDLTKSEVESWILSKEEELQSYKGHIAIVLGRETAKLGLEEKSLPWEANNSLNTPT